MKIVLKKKVVFGVLWFRWEHQSDEEIQNGILWFTSGNREIDKISISVNDISEISWG
jgi:hypothetical protein